MSGEPLPPAPDVPVMWLPGAASIRSAALYDAILQLVKRVKWIEYVMAEGTGSLPPPEYLTESEAAALFVPLTHLADANPHAQYLQQPAVQALVDAAVAAHVAQTDPHPTYLNVARGDSRYLPITYSPPPTDLSNYYTKAQADAAFLTQAEGDALFLTQAEGDLRYALIGSQPDLSNYWTKAQSDARYEPFDSAYTKGESDARYQPVGAYLTQTSGDARYLQLTGGALSGALTVQAKAVALDPLAGNTLAWNAAGFYSNAPTKAQYDALVARVAALEGQMGSGASGHYHPMGTWQQTAKAVIPVTVLEEATAA